MQQTLQGSCLAKLSAVVLSYNFNYYSVLAYDICLLTCHGSPQPGPSPMTEVLTSSGLMRSCLIREPVSQRILAEHSLCYHNT